MVRVPLSQIPTLEGLLAYAETHPYSLFLDSADTRSARFSYFLFNPRELFEGVNPFEVIEKFEKDFPRESTEYFCGGLAGFIGFEAARYLPDFAHIPFKKNANPDVVLGFYPFALVIDHAQNQSFLASNFLTQQELEEVKNQFEESKGDFSFGPFKAPDKKSYEKKIATIQAYLKAGDVYQINYTERFETSFKGQARSIYQAIRKSNPVPYGAFYNTGKGHILSFSPECFMETKGREIATYPIKGTVGRSHEKNEDALLQDRLKTSQKDKAEHVMIVDLERNDLGRICKAGSVNVSPLFGIESFSHVHHLVSRVSGILKEGIGFKEILEALFPGGSITGAPKRRAVEIIAELEENPRFVYTGALGFWGTGGLSVLNIPIRTLYVEGEIVAGYAGGGIVVDSTAQKEYEEMILKIESVLCISPSTEKL
ncbi:anthranilate synthase component I family protein [bacterium]|nr:anthranilate synthase component I family protein [bacterium]